MPVIRFTCLAAVLLAAVLSACRGGEAVDSSASSLPAGFSIETYAPGVSAARQMAMSPAGTLFVGSRTGQVYAILDPGRDGRGDEVITVA